MNAHTQDRHADEAIPSHIADKVREASSDARPPTATNRDLRDMYALAQDRCEHAIDWGFVYERWSLPRMSRGAR